MKTEILKKDSIIQNIKTSKKLKCYCVGTVFRGENNVVSDYIYSFYDSEKNKFKSFRHNDLIKMLEKNWEIKECSNKAK